MTRIVVPFLDANIIDVTVVAWHKCPGDVVEAGSLIAEVSTDKAAYEIEAPASGTLLAVFAPVKSIVPVKYVLGLIGADGETDAAVEADNRAVMAGYRVASGIVTEAPSSALRQPVAPQSVTPASPALRATPKVRRLAQAKGVDIAEVARATGETFITEAVFEKFLGSRL